jgi:hypothetical protein
VPRWRRLKHDHFLVSIHGWVSPPPMRRRIGWSAKLESASLELARALYTGGCVIDTRVSVLPPNPKRLPAATRSFPAFRAC